MQECVWLKDASQGKFQVSSKYEVEGIKKKKTTHKKYPPVLSSSSSLLQMYA